MRSTIFDYFLVIGLVVFLINKQVAALTDLSRLNCPDSYDVNVANITKPN